MHKGMQYAQLSFEGLHSTWRAYLAHVELNGPSPLFEDQVYSQFTENQLFFRNNAQVRVNGSILRIQKNNPEQCRMELWQKTYVFGEHVVVVYVE